MFRSGWRYIVAALVGLICFAASPPQEGARQHYPNAEQTPRGGEPVAAEPSEKTENAGEEKKPCEPGEDNRKSELCAQWKAADAAVDATVWARRTFWLGFWGLFVGVGTLFAAGIAAKGALDAAHYAKVSAGEASETNTLTQRLFFADQRPWISVKYGRPCDLSVWHDGLSFKVSVDAENVGKGPAIDVCVRIESIDLDAFGGKYIAALREVSDAYASIESGYGIIEKTIFQGKKDEFTVRETKTFIGVQSSISPIDIGLDYFVIITYKDAISGRRHCASAAFHITLQGVATYAHFPDSVPSNRWTHHQMPGANYLT